MALWGDKLMNIIVGGRPQGGRAITVEPGSWFNSTEPYMIPETYPAVERVPKDMLIFNWYWSTDSQSQQYFERKVFEQIYGNLAFQGSRAFQRWDALASSPTVLGGEVSTWCEVSEYAFGHDACFFNLAVGAQLMWWNGYCDNERTDLLDTVANLQPLVRDRLSGRRSPSLAASVDFMCYPLPPSNAEPVTIAGLPEGRTVLRGTPFDLGPAPGNVLRVDSKCPAAPIIPVNQCADSLIFLHHCQCERRYFTTYGDRYIVLPTPEGVLGWYIVRYADR
ncbi:unnamed protein product, partial [marine sediment metagenome]